MTPTIALIGRTNVGKSTLFNRLTCSNDAISADIPCLTRDRHYGQGKIGRKSFLVIDTGGFETQSLEAITRAMIHQTEQAVYEADCIFF